MATHIKNLLKQLPFYGKTIKPRTKEFTNAKLLSPLPFFEKPIKEKIKQLTTKNLLQEQRFYKQLIKKKRSFKYIIRVKITLKKRINVNEFDPKTLHCNSLIKTVKNQRYFLNDSFEEILNLSDIWINEGSE